MVVGEEEEVEELEIGGTGNFHFCQEVKVDFESEGGKEGRRKEHDHFYAAK